MARKVMGFALRRLRYWGAYWGFNLIIFKVIEFIESLPIQ